MLNQKIQAHRQEHASVQNNADDNSFTTISTVKVTELFKIDTIKSQGSHYTVSADNSCGPQPTTCVT